MLYVFSSHELNVGNSNCAGATYIIMYMHRISTKHLNIRILCKSPKPSSVSVWLKDVISFHKLQKKKINITVKVLILALIFFFSKVEHFY